MKLSRAKLIGIVMQQQNNVKLRRKPIYSNNCFKEKKLRTADKQKLDETSNNARLPRGNHIILYNRKTLKDVEKDEAGLTTTVMALERF
jgi:hypothetical protein